MSAVSTYSVNGNAYIDGVLGDLKWAPNSFTFSFPTVASYYGSSYGYGETTNHFGALNAAQQSAVRDSLALYASVANLSFTEIAETSTQHADLRFSMSDEPSTAWAYFPTTAPEGGDAWFNNSSGYYSSPAKGNYAYTTFLHEIGHAMGLEHAHEQYMMPVDRDSMEYTVMSYRSYMGGSTTSGYTNEKWGYAQSLMMYDIAALQHMYGANYSTNSVDTIYSWSPTTGAMSINGIDQGASGVNRIFHSVWDGGGTDTYNFSSYTTGLKVDLRPGQWTITSSTQLARLHYDGSQLATGNIANALLHESNIRSLIENATGGSGSDIIIGNITANILSGRSGNDWLSGGGGDDFLDGGKGVDTALFSGLKQQHTLTGNGSTRTVSSAEEGTDTLSSIEELQFLDGRITFDAADPAASSYRMYKAAFDRLPPDPVGLNYWIDRLESGGRAEDIGTAFVSSSEFNTRYGALDNSAFVEQLYVNVLGRQGEAGSVSFWTGHLDAQNLSRGQVLAGFAEGTENVGLTRAWVDAGIWDADEQASSVARLYSAAFDRVPDAGGLTYWINTGKTGASVDAVSDSFVFSSELQNKYGDLTNDGYVDQLYRNVLDRSASAGEVGFWSGHLSSGAMDRGDVLLDFADSTEHQIKTQAWLEDGLLFA